MPGESDEKSTVKETVLNQGQVVFAPVDLSKVDACIGVQHSFSDSTDDDEEEQEEE